MFLEHAGVCDEGTGLDEDLLADMSQPAKDHLNEIKRL
jgi:hypothetical protein